MRTVEERNLSGAEKGWTEVPKTEKSRKRAASAAGRDKVGRLGGRGCWTMIMDWEWMQGTRTYDQPLYLWICDQKTSNLNESFYYNQVSIIKDEVKLSPFWIYLKMLK